MCFRKRSHSSLVKLVLTSTPRALPRDLDHHLGAFELGIEEKRLPVHLVR